MCTNKFVLVCVKFAVIRVLKNMNKIIIGTSGYNYKHWANGVFYPHKLSQNKWLEFYSRHFKAVELNVTFYRLPSKDAFRSWHKRTSKDFIFVIKGNRYITHIKRLNDSYDSLKIFSKTIDPLIEKIRCVLWQLPPNFQKDSKRLIEFSKNLNKLKLTKLCRHCFEFRHSTWFGKDIYKILGDFNFSLCIADSGRWPQEEVITANFVYLRFHGGRQLYSSEYSESELKNWVKKAKIWLKQTKMLYAFFNNDAYGFAVKNALTFRKMLTNK